MASQSVPEVESSPITHRGYPVDVQIRICREGGRYGMDIQIQDWAPWRVSIDMQPHDLEGLNRRLQEELWSISCDGANDGSSMVAPSETQIRPLAEVGHLAFRQVFSEHDLWRTLQEILPLSQRLSIQVTSEAFFLPWELLYPVSLLDDPVSLEYFWGMNYIISRLIPQRFYLAGAPASPSIRFLLRPRLGLLVYNRLPSVERKEIPFFERMDRSEKIFLSRLRALDPAKRPEEFGELRDFLSNEFNLVHFACHASYDDKSHSLSNIRLSDEFLITLEDIENYEVVINGNPLVVLNACETGNLNPLYTSHFAAMFLKHGARGVVATECAVSDAFAADFAEHLYCYLLAGRPLGKSLLATRQHFFKKHHNPSGLLYSMYAPPSTKLTQVGG